MDKISITINGKTFEAKGENLFEIIDNFLSDTTKEEQYNDIPKEYDNYEEYLCLDDFNPAKCTTKEQLDDLQKKLNERLVWVFNHPKANLEYVKHHLDNMKADVEILQDKVTYIMKAYQAVLRYINEVKVK